MNFKPHIQAVYPPHNEIIFEEWFAENYKGCNTERELLPIYFTSFYVNNNYGNDLEKRKELQEYINSLDTSKKYFSIVQYDDSILEDTRHLDLFRFEMSKTIGVGMPLMCQPHPFKFNSDKKYLASFIGSRTHPCRNGLEKYINKDGWYISYDPHPIEEYCKIMSQSWFTLCPRGYGLNSFRISEALQYGSIPIYISDEFVQPFDLNFDEYGILYKSEDIGSLAMYLSMLDELEIINRIDRIPEIYVKYYTYEGAMRKIIEILENEVILKEKKYANTNADYPGAGG